MTETAYLHHTFVLMLCFMPVTSVGIVETCATFQSCIGHTLNGTGLTRVYGYNAASNPSTSFSGGSIECSASYSCHSMSFIRAYAGELLCSANHACSNTTIQNINTTISCDASYACIYSTILPSPKLHCAGFRSCESANITGVPIIYSWGMLSLYKAIIDTLNSAVSVINVYLRSRLSAYGASFICRNHHECHIYCDAIDACFMFHVDCIGDCVIHQITGNYQVPIHDLAQFNKIDFNNLTFDSHLVNLEPHTNTLCVMDKWSFDNSNEQKNRDSIAVKIDNEGPICCRGFSSCADVGIIEYKTQTKKDLICSGHESCRFAAMIQNINDSVFCEGMESCKQSTLHYIDNIYCAGPMSCSKALITGAKHIMCSTSISCISSTIISGGNDVIIYADGYRGAERMTLYCNDTDECIVHCVGYLSCQYAVFICNNNCIVYCHDEFDLSYCQILNPTPSPTVPLIHPTFYPTIEPIEASLDPTINPTYYPTFNPTINPTLDPTSSSLDLTVSASKKSKLSNNLLYITLILGSSVVNILAIYFARRFYLKQKKNAAQELLQMSAIIKQNVEAAKASSVNPAKASSVNPVLCGVGHHAVSTSDVNDIVMEYEEKSKDSDSNSSDSLYVKKGEIEEKEFETTGRGTTGEKDVEEEEGVPAHAEVHIYEPGFIDVERSDDIYADDIDAPQKPSDLDPNAIALNEGDTQRSNRSLTPKTPENHQCK